MESLPSMGYPQTSTVQYSDLCALVSPQPGTSFVPQAIREERVQSMLEAVASLWQSSPVQYSTVQYSTVQYSTILCTYLHLRPAGDP